MAGMCPLKMPFLGPTLGVVFQWFSLASLVLGGGALSRFSSLFRR
jgi:hypothetical protein